ncbi:MAG: oxidoreductase, partial [Leptospiraceae bacterium]|nr:oxidoreductase [Leptospiraceae bacterium]
MGKKAILIGTNGLIGSECLQLLLESPAYSVVESVARKNISIEHPKLKSHVIDFEHLSDLSLEGPGDVFCCLGTTMKKAGSRENFEKVDYSYITEFARYVLGKGFETFILISSMGANPNSLFFYNQVKGKTEAYIQKLNFPSLYILRPSLLLGDRKESRPMEKVAASIFEMASPLFFFSELRKYRPIHSRVVARAMLKFAEKAEKGSFVYESE